MATLSRLKNELQYQRKRKHWKRSVRFPRCTNTTTTWFLKRTRKASTTSIPISARWLTSTILRLKAHLWQSKPPQKSSKQLLVPFHLREIFLKSKRLKKRSKRKIIVIQLKFCVTTKKLDILGCYTVHHTSIILIFYYVSHDGKRGKKTSI